MMNKFERNLLWCAFVTYLSAPGIAYSSSWNYQNEPLWLGDAVKHNMMFALDDSGSMDSEVLFDNNDGALYIANDGYFSNSSGSLNASGSKYVYLFPNGESSTYNGKRVYSDGSGHYAIAPIPAYAFARSPDYNNAYYDPSETYYPWPTYGGYTYTEPDPANPVPYEAYAGFGSDSLDLFSEFTSTQIAAKGSNWDFRMVNANMVCDADGNTCTAGSNQDIGYYPATYYLKQDSGSIYFKSPFLSSDSVLFEAEDETHSSPMLSGSTLEKLVAAGGNTSEQENYARALGASSKGDFVGTKIIATDSIGSVPSDDGIEMSFAVPDTSKAGPYKIWMRIYAQGDANDSFYVRLRGNNTVLSSPENTFLTGDGDGDWKRVRDSVFADNEWIWVEWGEVEFADTNAKQFIDVKWRESGTYIDQILVTANTTDAPVSIALLDGQALDCVSDTSAELYQFYARNPDRFQVSASDTSRIDGLAYDGSCLKKYEIGKTQADSEDFVNGAGVARTVLEEKQNFATWFQYHRRRHQAMRGAVASSMAGLNDIYAGLFWINNRRTVTMRDWSVQSEVNTFLTDHYGYVGRSGTPLRRALDHAGAQYQRHDVNGDGDITSPVGSECQKNYTLLFTDGYNSDGRKPDGTFDVTVADDDSDKNAPIPYQDDYPNTLADIAYKYYQNFSHAGSFDAGKVRIPTECSNSPDPWLDCNTNLHMTTYTVGLGTKGTLFGLTHNGVEDVHNNPPTWPDVNAGTRNAQQVDDLLHAAVNGRGQMYNAASSAELTRALGKAMDDIVKTIGSGSGVTFNSSSLRSNDGTSIYSTLFNSTNWSGNLIARALDGASGAVKDKVWKDSNGNDVGAAELLDERDLNANPRVILTMENVSSKDGVAFQWANLTDAQKNDLLYPETTATATADDIAFAQSRLAWVRGDMSNTVLRSRGSRLGDIVHSSPVYVGVPGSRWPDADPFGYDGTKASNFTDRNRYSDFKNRTKTEGGAADRFPVVYVGANDGMLHGFNGSNNATEGGDEVLAYIPSDVYSTQLEEGLHYLTDPQYVHNYYVDGTPVAQDVYTYKDATQLAAGVTTARDWRTLLVGGLRGGGTGLYALDVTHPDEFSEANAANTVFWEFNETNAPDAKANLGYRTSPPTIVMLPNDKWAVVFGNGYDSINGRAVLFIVYIEEGLDGTWTLNDDYVMIDTSLYGGPSSGNGLSGVSAADTDGDLVADRIYAGDEQGNMWVFDVSSDTAFNNKGDALWTASKLFTAQHTGTDANGDPVTSVQPIMAPPAVAFNSDQVTSTNAPNILVTFGTGRYLEKDDITNTSVQSYYTVWDRGTSGLDRSNLTERTLEQDGTTLNLTGQKDGEGNAIYPWDPSSGLHGWYFNFTPSGKENGERLINRPLLRADKDQGPISVFASMIPETSECAGGGSSAIYGFPLLTGLNPTKPVLDLNGDGKVDELDEGVGATTDDLVNEINCIGDNCYASKGEDDTIKEVEGDFNSGGDREGRLGWFELIDE